MYNRRSFLTTSSLAVAGLVLGAREISALTTAQRAMPGAAFLPQPAETDDLKHLAQVAVDAARQAGASFADVRIGEDQILSLAMGFSRGDPVNTEPSIRINAIRKYGVRVLVDGVWGFMYGDTLTHERLAQAAREAVAHARQIARINVREGIKPIELLPVPVVTGTWESPMEIDPFSVPIQAQAEPLGALLTTAERVLAVTSASAGTAWVRQTRVFASSEGSLLVQRAYRALPHIDIKVSVDGGTELRRGLPELATGSTGFEVLTDPQFPERVKGFAEELIRWASYPPVEMDVGRYPVTIEGHSAVSFVKTLMTACELDRALGTEGDTAGTSFLSPPAETLASATPHFSPQVTLGVTPTERNFTSFKWDNEGVLNKPHTLIDKGRVTGYISSRETARELEKELGKELGANAPIASSGGSAVGDIGISPMVGAGEVSLSPGSKPMTLDDLILQIPNGAVMTGPAHIIVDPGLHTGSARGDLFRVREGKVIGRVFNASMLFRTQRFWKDNLLSIGDASTMRTDTRIDYKAMPPQIYQFTITAPAMLVKDMDVTVRKMGRR